MSNTTESLRAAFQNRTATVGVIGLGYVGLPLLDAFISKGFACVGFDIDAKKVEQLNAGRSYIKHVSSEKVSAWREAKKFEATADLARLREPDALIICVPTPLTDSRDPDLSFVEGTARSIAA